jgi:Sodium/hydrogen exchanger family
LGIALLVGHGFQAGGLVQSPLLVAIILTATGLGVVIPVLKDAGQTASDFGQLVIAAASIADFGAVVLLSLFFSREATGPGAKLLLIGGLVLLAVGVGAALTRAGRWRRLSEDLGRLQDTSAQIRVRGAVLLLAVFVWLTQQLGLEVILGAFLAGALLRVVDQDAAMTHPRFRAKLEALGFGMFVPIFFVVSGVRFDLAALAADASALTMVPLFLVALLVVRGLPALLYRHGWGRTGRSWPRCCRRPRCRSSWPPHRSAWSWASSLPPAAPRSSPPVCSRSCCSRCPPCLSCEPARTRPRSRWLPTGRRRPAALDRHPEGEASDRTPAGGPGPLRPDPAVPRRRWQP